MRSPEIRERFLHFFEARGHRRLPSASLIPHDDPSILFNVAGMVPLKPYFLGLRRPPAERAASCQKCFRTVDIEEVGRTPRHVTFFEMLGNFSFGDYSKETAIPLAWELLTGDYGLPSDRLWPTVHPDDGEAAELWTGAVGVPAERVGRLEENWWPAGAPVPGPCGPDSEIHWDRQVPCSCGRSDCRPGCPGDRWVEIWNLVFMEYDRDAEGRLQPLPRPSIDTGMGLERITAVLQGRDSIFDTDLFEPLLAGLERRCSAAAREQPAAGVSLRICADHLRAAAFLIADGVRPGPDRRGYVLRWLIRRAGIHGRRLGLSGGLAPGVADLVSVMAPAYPELAEGQDRIVSTLGSEEGAFASTLEEGAARLESMLAGGSAVITGEDAFLLHDTYGLPIELTTEMASERGALVDLAGFEAAMEQQRERSRPSQRRGVFAAGAALPETDFVGYESLEARATVAHIGTESGSAVLAAGESGEVMLDRSPFYAEAGGQIGDTGALLWEGGSALVLDTVPVPGSDARAHRVRLQAGRLVPGAEVVGRVDGPRRAQIARHHTATHLLHRSLREVLGESATQHGSYVGPDHTTFDFSFDRALSEEELGEIESRVNRAIRDNLDREIQQLPIAEARASGAVALFGERYGEVVRVVDFGGWARELCGGTHVDRSGDIGAAIIVSDSSIGRGLRRIEMVAGEAAQRRWFAAASALGATARLLRARPDEVPARVGSLQAQLRRLHRELEEARRGRGGASAVARAVEESAGSVRLAHLTLDNGDGSAVTEAADRIFAELLNTDGVVVVLGTHSLAIKVGGSALEAGISAGELVRVGAERTGGTGGGRPNFARGGVGDPGRRAEALQAIREVLSRGGRGS